MAKKVTNFRKLINLIESFDMKREKLGVPMDIYIAEQYRQLIHWASYADETYMESKYDLTKLIFGKIKDKVELISCFAEFLEIGKFSEHKESDILNSECSAISKMINTIAEDLNEQPWREIEEDEEDDE